MDKFEDLILRWVCLFDDFKDLKCLNIKTLVSSVSFKEFVDNVFCFKCSTALLNSDEKLYNTIKINYPEFEVETYEDLYKEENTVYTCIVILLHALLKCTNNKYRYQLSDRMDNKEQVFLASFLEATQSSLFIKEHISKSLDVASNTQIQSPDISEIFSDNVTPIKSKSIRRSYLQEFCESPQSQSLIHQEKEKLIAKLTEDIKNECEENEKLSEHAKVLQYNNLKLSSKLEDKEKVIQFLKDEIEELTKSKDTSDIEVDNSLIIRKLNQDILDLEMNNNELKQQIIELENLHKDINTKFEKKTTSYENLLLTLDTIESENMLLKDNINSFKEILQKKDTEITSLKDELSNKSISNNLMNSSCQGLASNTLFDELNCLKLEEVTHDKEKYRHKYKSVKKDLLNMENHVKDLDEQVLILKQQLQDYEIHKDKMDNKLSDKKKELQECEKKMNNLETKIKHLKDTIKDKENCIESKCNKLEKKENQIKELLVEIDTVKKAKTMIELILNKTNMEIEALHEENQKSVHDLLITIEGYKNSEELFHKNIMDLQNDVKQMKDNLENKTEIITFYENKAAEYYQTIGIQEEQLKSLYQEKIILQSHLKDMTTKTNTQEKMFNNKQRDMENTLEYHLDELKDVKNTVSKLEEILCCKQNEVDQQNELINYQKNVTETLQSDKCIQEINIKNLNSVLDQKSIENNDLKEKIQELTSNISTLKEQLNATLNQKSVLEENVKTYELQIKKTNKEFYCQINDMKNILGSQSNEINRYKIDLEKLKEALTEKQNDFNKQLIISNEQIETISHLRLEKYELEEKLKSSGQIVLNKEYELKLLEDRLNQNTLKIKDLSEKVILNVTENNFLTQSLNMINMSLINMQEDFNKQLLSMKTKLQLYDNNICAQTEKLLKLKNYLLVKINELNNQIEMTNKQKDYIASLETEKQDLFKKIKAFDKCLLDKNTEITNFEKKLEDHHSTITDLKEQLLAVSKEKVTIETNLNTTAEQLKNSEKQFTEQINNILVQLSGREEEIIKLKKQSTEIENMFENKKKELQEQVELTHKQYEIVKHITLEKNILEKQVLSTNEHSINNLAEIKSLKDKLDEFKSAILKLEKKLENVLKEKISFETKLKDTVNEKEIINQEFHEQMQSIKNRLEDIIQENNDLKNNLIDLNTKQIKFQHVTEENNTLKEAVDNAKNQYISLQDKLKDFNDCLLKKEEHLNLLETQNSEYSTVNENLKKQIGEVKQALNKKHVELENQIQWCNEQRETIVKLNKEKEYHCNHIKNLESSLSHKEYEFNLCEGKLYDCSNTINNLEKKIDIMKNEKSSLELQLNEITSQLIDKTQNLNLQLELQERKFVDIHEKLVYEQSKFQKQIELSNEQIKTISLLTTEKDIFLEKISKLQESLNENECSLKSLQEQLNDYKEKYEELQSLIMDLSFELDGNKTKLTNMHQESRQKLMNMQIKFTEIQAQLNKKQIDFDDYISKYNCQIETNALLTTERDNLVKETSVLKSILLNKDNVIATNQKKLLEYEELNNEINIEKDAFKKELKQTNEQLEITLQGLTQQLEENEIKLYDLQEQLNCKHMNLQLQKKETEKQIALISNLTLEKNNLINETNAIKNCLLEKDNTLASNHIKLINYESQLEELHSQKSILESDLNETKLQLDHIRHDSIQKQKTSNDKLKEVQELLSKVQADLNNQKKYSNEQVETINALISEKNNLIVETNKLKECLTQKEESALTLNQNKEDECKHVLLMFELNELKNQLNYLQQESAQRIIEMDKHVCDVHKQLSLKQSEIKKQIELKNDSLVDIYRQIHNLKTIKNELELILKKEKTVFETCLETYSINCCNNKPIIDDHENSLMEVITSAHTFIEQNSIQIALVENSNDYSIIERLKHLFDALKMFIININTQGNKHAVIHTNTDYTSNDAYAELLATSNKQLETIKNMETEMSKLKSECNYKMSRVQQKTQEYVTSEFEKKFERKREQMKQFCKDLETKMHQDYEAKLIKYKEKIKKDENHIKELGHQLWEISDKFSRLQQQNRRESTISLPYEIPVFSHTVSNVPKYNSLTLPKSSSAGQIRSLTEENTHYQDHSKRNVPVGIGKKFSLSSGKIFPKEEDEEGEVFNHSCLADLKQGRVNLNDINDKQYNERLSELQARNSLCPPHLRSCYAVETNFLPNTSLITEEEIKTIINYSDCENENLIPNDRNKKKDRNQTSYKKPGPPTPSKNGGRASLSGNSKITLKEPKETNTNKKRTSSTPNKLFSLFMSKK